MSQNEKKKIEKQLSRSACLSLLFTAKWIINHANSLNYI